MGAGFTAEGAEIAEGEVGGSPNFVAFWDILGHFPRLFGGGTSPLLQLSPATGEGVVGGIFRRTLADKMGHWVFSANSL